MLPYGNDIHHPKLAIVQWAIGNRPCRTHNSKTLIGMVFRMVFTTSGWLKRDTKHETSTLNTVANSWNSWQMLTVHTLNNENHKACPAGRLSPRRSENARLSSRKPQQPTSIHQSSKATVEINRKQPTKRASIEALVLSFPSQATTATWVQSRR